MLFLEVLAKIVSIASGIVLIVTNCKKYIDRQAKKKDSSSSFQAPDESHDELHK